MKTFAILGASGFIGYRLTEYLLLNEAAIPRPVVRSFHSMARAARFDLDIRLADATDVGTMASAIKDCDAAFHCITGDREVILRSIKSTYLACRQAGVRRLIYLSSSVVHGLTPLPGTDENSALIKRQNWEYNNSKVLAERELRSLMKDGAVEVVILRPSIVFGPRSTYFTGNIAQEVLRGKAYLVNDGRGICNTIYVDNLVELMVLCAEDSRAPGNTFLTKDAERVTWRQLYTAVAVAVGVDPANIPSIDLGDSSSSDSRRLRDATRFVWKSRFGRATRELFRAPATISLASKMRLHFRPADTRASARRSNDNKIAIDPFLGALQKCDYELPTRKLEEVLGYRPAISFQEACRLTGEWLRFALGAPS
jgi:nucleoside-diphosphate-sugar epimerase